MPHDQRWNWYSNNRNKVHNKCNALESSPSQPQLVGKLFWWNWSLVPKRLGTVACSWQFGCRLWFETQDLSSCGKNGCDAEVVQLQILVMLSPSPERMTLLRCQVMIDGLICQIASFKSMLVCLAVSFSIQISPAHLTIYKGGNFQEKAFLFEEWEPLLVWDLVLLSLNWEISQSVHLRKWLRASSTPVEASDLLFWDSLSGQTKHLKPQQAERFIL